MLTDKNTGVYKIVNSINGRFYIGSSININKRWNEHRRMLNKNKHDNKFLQNSWNKHGEKMFTFNIIEHVGDINLLLVREQYYLDLFKSDHKKLLYNICLVAGNMLGFKHSDKTKKLMSEKLIGNEYSLGHRHSDKTKENMSISHIGFKHKDETIIKMINKPKKEILKSIKYKTTKISIEIKNELIEKYNSGLYSTRKLSKLYGVSKSTIWNIVIVN